MVVLNPHDYEEAGAVKALFSVAAAIQEGTAETFTKEQIVHILKVTAEELVSPEIFASFLIAQTATSQPSPQVS